MNIVFTGGHAATTAISVIKEIQKRHRDWSLYWIGPKSAVEGKYLPTLASQVIPKLGVTYLPITTGRLQRKFTLWTIPSLIKIPIGFFMALRLLSNVRPKIIVSFGGYASVPVCFAGWILQIPILIHEQTVVAGRANKLVSSIAKEILLAREESREYFSKNKTVVVGNPISEDLLKIKPKYELKKRPVIYITGGSSGAQRINNVVKETLYDLLKEYRVIHQTGSLDFEKFKKFKDQFPADLRQNYEIHDFIDPKKIPAIFAQADLVISRGGANTISEIMVTKRPAIIIPIPWSAYNEQVKNAKSLEKTGLGIVLEEKDLSPENLLKKVDFCFKNWQNMIRNSDTSLADLDRFAAQKFVDEIEPALQI